MALNQKLSVRPITVSEDCRSLERKLSLWCSNQLL